jgi:hypothetical protein
MARLARYKGFMVHLLTTTCTTTTTRTTFRWRGRAG